MRGIKSDGLFTLMNRKLNPKRDDEVRMALEEDILEVNNLTNGYDSLWLESYLYQIFWGCEGLPELARYYLEKVGKYTYTSAFDTYINEFVRLAKNEARQFIEDDFPFKSFSGDKRTNTINDWDGIHYSVWVGYIVGAKYPINYYVIPSDETSIDGYNSWVDEGKSYAHSLSNGSIVQTVELGDYFYTDPIKWIIKQSEIVLIDWLKEARESEEEEQSIFDRDNSPYDDEDDEYGHSYDELDNEPMG